MFESAESTSSAVISDCGLYRYELIRRWGAGKLVEFIMLNPSTADAAADDPTIRRCMGFARAWRYDGIIVRNLYAYRSTDPRGLVAIDDPIGPRNREFLTAGGAGLTIVAWGSHPAASHWWHNCHGDVTDTAGALRQRELWCLGINGNGSPKHPLYIPGRVAPRRWTPA
ncbi:hypothetical protein ABW16_01850 [Mycolicibacter heraklionensis]|uniref:DUF1643 domain-containing protein n=1 Tax=Mycolicibacter heraklionensis TaxID=512402 RepID=A0ABR5FLN2_9MYCO|nr:hypothetical protein ABW16_01850 [Mycolicibacter heraklionensis]